jgi:succinyl-CoA synthetase alpha subunit
MSILVDSATRVVIQGITGHAGAFHNKLMLEYGTKVVAGVTPGKGGTTADGVPVFDTLAEAVGRTGAEASVIFVPAAIAADAIEEAAAEGVKLIVCITERIPALDVARARAYIRERGARLIGTSFVDVLDLFERDEATQAVVLIGEIGGAEEEEAAEFIRARFTKPVVAFIAGRTAPPGKRMGHAGAITSRSSGTAAEKIAALQKAGVRVELNPARIGRAMQELLSITGTKS